MVDHAQCYCGRALGAYKKLYCSYMCALKAYRGRPYGLGPEEVQELWRVQGGKCAICAAPFDPEIRHPAVDHDHMDGRVRGLLCAGCNLTLGRMERDLRNERSNLASYGTFGVMAAEYLADPPYRRSRRIEEDARRWMVYAAM